MPDGDNLLTGTDNTVPQQGEGADKGETEEAGLLTQALKEGEQQPEEGGKPEEPEEKEKGEGKKPEVPEKYEIKLPEGFEVDEGALEIFTPVFKEVGLTNEQAQKLADAYIEMQKKDAEAYINEINKWKEQAKNDPEYGGTKLKENLAVASRAMREVFSEKTIALMDYMGLTSHPEVIRDLWKLGLKISEDRWVGGKPAGTTEDESGLTPEEKLARRYMRNQR